MERFHGCRPSTDHPCTLFRRWPGQPSLQPLSYILYILLYIYINILYITSPKLSFFIYIDIDCTHNLCIWKKRANAGTSTSENLRHTPQLRLAIQPWRRSSMPWGRLVVWLLGEKKIGRDVLCVFGRHHHVLPRLLDQSKRSLSLSTNRERLYGR